MSDQAKPTKKEPQVKIAFGVHKTPLGWIATEYKIQDDKIIEQKTTEPDMRVIALEKMLRDIDYFWAMA